MKSKSVRSLRPRLLFIIAIAIALGVFGGSVDSVRAQTYDLLVSSFPDRSGSVPLAGATVTDGIAVYVNPDTGITQVRFFLDGTIHQTENRAPWDFEGTAGGAARPAKLNDTTQIADGPHTISAEIDLSAGGTEVVSATFTVANNAPALLFSPDILLFAVMEGGSTPDKTTTLDTNDATVAAYTVSDNAPWLTVSPGSASIPDTLTLSVDTTGLAVGTYIATVTAVASGYLSDILSVTLNVGASYDLLMSSFADRSGSVPLEGASVTGDIAVFVSPDTGITQVRFLLDGILHQTENKAPWDFEGTAGGAAKLYDTTQIADGSHTISAEIDLSAGGTVTISATFTVVNNVPALLFSPDILSFAVAEGGSAFPQTVGLDTNDATVAAYTVSDDAPWLTVSPGSGSTPDTVSLSIDATGLAAGLYTATVTATASGYLSDTLSVTLNVGASYNLLVSSFADRSSSVPLEGASVTGDVAVYIDPDTGITQVRFYLDAVLHQTENRAPWDFEGTVSGAAKLYDATQLADGPHTISAEIDLSAGGTEVLSATFDVLNNVPELVYSPDVLSFAVEEGGGASPQTANLSTTDATVAAYTVSDDAPWLDVSPPTGSTPDTLTVSVNATGLTIGIYTATVSTTAPGYLSDSLSVILNVGGSYDLLVSSSSDRSSPLQLEGQTVAGDIAVFISPDAGINQVRFFLDGTLHHTENDAPWDFNETNFSNGSANLYSTAQLVDGLHTISVEIDLAVGGTLVASATFDVLNNVPELVFSPDVLSFGVEEGGGASPQTANLSTTDATVAAYTVSDDAPWLDVSPQTGSTPDTLTVSVNATGLTIGIYTATVSATAPGYLSESLSVTLNVGGAYDLLVSSSSDRSSPLQLEGQTVAGDIAVFISPDAGINQVRFYLDGILHQTENNAPWDFEGTVSGAAKLYDTTQIADGPHTISAEIDLSAGGTEVVSANFTVANTGPALVFSPNILSFAVVESGSTPDKTTTLDTNDATVAAYNVSDDAAWLTVSPGSGSTPDTLSLSVDATGLAVGTYTATVNGTASGYLPGVLTVTLNVSATLAPDQVHLAWVSEPSTTLTVVWRTLDTATPSVVEYRPLGDVTWQSATGAPRPSGTTGILHEVTLTSLTPITTYEYRVSGDGTTWSGVYTTRTAPPPGPADFDAIYVADTGLIGRSDGLATGTQQVIDEIANLNPMLVLLGGDYAYFNTDKRFGSFDNTIDAWFNQMQSIGAQSPMMPTYGNHEVLLGEGFDEWAARFPTPAGFDGRRNYSFDVGDVHFVSILAVSDIAGLSSATLQWIDQDITDAITAGKTWIIPFLHVSPFGDGTNHPDNETLRAQLGPIFESHGVKVVFTAQDQAYERSYPLTDIPATNTPTSTSESCYTMGDGVTWVKVSPGGKLSNINGSFSQFATDPPPAWTAYRNNTMHAFARLNVLASGSITVEAYGVIGDGTPPVVMDSFQYTTGSCPPELAFSANTISFTAEEGGSVSSQTMDLAASDDSAASYTVSDDADWLIVTPASGLTLEPLTISVDPAGLTPGFYNATVTATAPGYLPDTLIVSLIVGDAYDLLVSSSSDRSSPLQLDGQTVAGDIYVFIDPGTGITQARFFLDDPGMIGSPIWTENNPPHDFAGGSANTATPFDSTTVADGSHTVSAEIDLSAGGIFIISATFTVANNAPALVFSPDVLSFALEEGGGASPQSASLSTTDGTVATFTVGDDAPWLDVSPLSGSTPDTLTVSVNATGLTIGIYTATVSATAPGYLSDTLFVTMSIGDTYNLLVSSLADRSSSVPLAGETIAGNIYAFIDPGTGITQARFFLDNPGMIGSPIWTENNPPHDFAGGSVSTANAFDTGTLADGSHTISAELDLSAGGTELVSATFVVINGCFPLPCSAALVSMPYELDYDHRHDHGGILDTNGVGTGFTYMPPTTNGTGYIPTNLLVDLVGGTFQITTTAGLADTSSNSQDNALTVGIDAPSQVTVITTTLLNPPAGTGNDEQAGLWFGNDEDNYVKLIVISTPSGTIIEYLMEANGSVVDSTATGLLDLTGATVSLRLRADPTDRTIAASYSIDGGPTQALGTFVAPGEFFSFDAAGIDPVLGTRSFAGIAVSHDGGPSPLVYTFSDFIVTGVGTPTASGNFPFTKSSFPVSFPTSLDWGPDDRLYVATLFGTIHALTYDEDKQVVNDEVITALLDDLGSRLTLGVTIDPLSTPSNVILWVSHSSPSLNDGIPNSGMISRLSGPNFTTVEHIITGLPRAKANHATNSIHFGPAAQGGLAAAIGPEDDMLYIAQGGNTGAGSPNLANTEFGTMEEQPLSAAILVADVRNPAFDGSCNNPADIFGPPPCDVVPFGTGLRNAYDFVIHSNGSMYAPDNGLGVTGTYPPSPTPPCFGLADPALHDPGSQPDELFRIEQGMYYGHPNPYRDECVFKDGSLQGVPPLPNWSPPILDLGNNRSADGTIEYTSDAFCGELKGDLLIANFSVGDDITRISLSADGLSVLSAETLVGGFDDPLPLAMGPDGTIYVGEFGGQVTALAPVDLGCWTTEQPVPVSILDAGGAALDGKLYMVGGKTSIGHVSTMYIYDPVTDTWTSGPDLPGPAVENPAVAALSGKLYVFGGSTAPFSGAVNNAAVYDPATNSWTILTLMSIARGGAAAQAISGKIYVVGGLNANGVSLASVEVYDPATDSWSFAAPMSTPRDNPGSAVLGGKLYIFGGRDRGVNETLSTVEMYDPATDTWTARAPMPTGRRAMVVGILNGRAQVMGGEKAADGGTFPQNEEYNPIANTWRTLEPMPTPRHGAAGGTINGVVYVAGGGAVGGSSFTDVVEAFAFQNP